MVKFSIIISITDGEMNINDCLRKFGKIEFSTKPIYYYNL